VLGAIAIIILGGILLLPHFKKHATVELTPAIVSQAPPGPIPPPKVKRAKSLNDLKIGSFNVQPQRGSEVRIVSGDIENDSESLHRNLKVELDLHDARGLKVDSLQAFVTELVPHGVWHVLAQTTESRAATVRVVGLREEP
jgi:RNAse (barnase) inhibitor barstar